MTGPSVMDVLLCLDVNESLTALLDDDGYDTDAVMEDIDDAESSNIKEILVDDVQFLLVHESVYKVNGVFVSFSVH